MFGITCFMTTRPKRKAPNYALKSQLIKNGIYNDFRKATYDIHIQNENYDSSYEYLFKMKLLNIDSYKECYRISNSLFHRNMRVRQKIQDLLIQYDKCYFLTLTFTDDYLNRTSEITRRRQVARWLKSNCFEYIANIDFGSKNDREHYHAVCSFKNKVDYTSFIGGAVNSKLIVNKNPYKLKNYINKLTYHAMKESTHQIRLIYSRKSS